MIHKNIEYDPTGIDEIFNDDDVNEEIAKRQAKRKPPKQKKPIEVEKKKERIKIEKKINKQDPYKYLNNLTFTNDQIDKIKLYLKTDELPNNLNERQKKAFIKNYSMNWNINENGELIFIPLNLKVVLNNDINSILEKLYLDPVKSLGKGYSSFYDTVKSEYVGITRKDVENFLKKQENYQMTFTKKKKNRKTNLCYLFK